MTHPTAREPSPQMTDGFAAAYEATAHRITGPVSIAALDLVGIAPGLQVLDIAAGAGALSGPAAERGADVLATDIAPGMVRRLAERLRPFPRCAAAEMDGEDLRLADASFDAAFSIFGVILFPNWRKGLREQARVLRPGGVGCVATWRSLPGGGPFMVMASALRAVFPDRPPPPSPPGMMALSDPDALAAGMEEAGFEDVRIHQVEGIWRGSLGDAYLRDLNALHGYMKAYADLDEADQALVRAAMLRIVDAQAEHGVVEFRTPVLIAVGRRG